MNDDEFEHIIEGPNHFRYVTRGELVTTHSLIDVILVVGEGKRPTFDEIQHTNGDGHLCALQMATTSGSRLAPTTISENNRSGVTFGASQLTATLIGSFSGPRARDSGKYFARRRKWAASTSCAAGNKHAEWGQSSGGGSRFVLFARNKLAGPQDDSPYCLATKPNATCAGGQFETRRLQFN